MIATWHYLPAFPSPAPCLPPSPDPSPPTPPLWTGTHEILLQDNIAYNIMAHAYFLEDGIETGNVLERNLVRAGIRCPSQYTQALPCTAMHKPGCTHALPCTSLAAHMQVPTLVFTGQHAGLAPTRPPCWPGPYSASLLLSTLQVIRTKTSQSELNTGVWEGWALASVC